ncbi:hypothetical protein [Paraburkholderia sp. ZP32-5]|uniref:hypothetical protein n=1 Tax=Paraburkholderia sp. ZP32-5 TaxID=2883245 RepID=UPI001F401509|nr:hypothetical protein [Paraburkholderia sp. ZP32-5]
MFFTKSSWQSPMKLTGDVFTRWEMTGVTHYSTVFVVRSTQTRRDDGDGYSYFVSGPQLLKAMLEGANDNPVQVYALEWDRLVAVHEFWSYPDDGRFAMVYFAYSDAGGRVSPCEPMQPDPESAGTRTLVWRSVASDGRFLTETAS